MHCWWWGGGRRRRVMMWVYWISSWRQFHKTVYQNETITIVNKLDLITLYTSIQTLCQLQLNIRFFRIYTTGPLHLHAFNILLVNTSFIDRSCGSIKVHIAEKQIVCATSKYCDRSRDQQRYNCLVDQSFDCAITDILPIYAPRQHILFTICKKKCIVEDMPKI